MRIQYQEFQREQSFYLREKFALFMLCMVVQWFALSPHGKVLRSLDGGTGKLEQGLSECSPIVSAGFLWVLWLPSTVQRHDI